MTASKRRCFPVSTAETADAIRASVLDGIRQIRRMPFDRELFEKPA